jgi:histidinol dehydrogenase
LKIAGATEIYKMGGAHAIAALAYGTKTIRSVEKIFGPGNAFVVEAKRQVFGTVAIDLIPGPSEVLVIADKTAPPKWIALDLLAQAEHGIGSQAILLTDSIKLMRQVYAEIEKNYKNFKRKKYIQEALRNSLLIIVKKISDAIEIANSYAPEHVSVMTKNSKKVVDRLTTSGAIFIGPYSPVTIGDFVAGPSHTLPTGGSGKSFSGLSSDMFQKRTSIIEYDKRALQKSLAAVEKFATIEGLDAHGQSARIRFEKKPIKKI